MQEEQQRRPGRGGRGVRAIAVDEIVGRAGFSEVCGGRRAFDSRAVPSGCVGPEGRFIEGVLSVLDGGIAKACDILRLCSSSADSGLRMYWNRYTRWGAPINTPLQRGVWCSLRQRTASAVSHGSAAWCWKTAEAVPRFDWPVFTPLKRGVNESGTSKGEKACRAPGLQTQTHLYLLFCKQL